MTSVTLAWLAELVVITYRSAKQEGVGKLGITRPIPHLPMPSEYAATFVVYGALSLIPGQGEQVAGYIGWGIVLATVLNLWDPRSVGNPGGVAVKGGPSTKQVGSGPTVSPTQTQTPTVATTGG
jgi:hypothetical protein